MTRTPRTIAFWHGRLPHWEVEDGRYFITIHLSGAIPHEDRLRLRQLSNEIAHKNDCSAPDWLRLSRLIFQEMEHWLDSVPTVTHLQNSDVAAMVTDAIEHRQRRRDWQMLEYVVMPTHIHLFCELGGEMKTILEDFKRWTGHEAIKILGSGKDSRFWQREWFDHWSRSDEEDERISRYIRNNPVKAGLASDFAQWEWGSWQVRPAGRD